MASLTRTYNQKKLLGQVYTPPFIVHKILDEVGLTGTGFLGKKILDPACGDGRFLVEVVRRILLYSPASELRENLQKVYGWDVDSEALTLCREALDQEVAPFIADIHWRLYRKDALQQVNKKDTYRYIVGNPPYIRIQHLPEHQRQYLQESYEFCKSGSTDTFVAFFELADRLLDAAGECGFITPNSYFFSETARPLRQYFLAQKNLRLITNYGSVPVFDKTGTYAAITVFGKKASETFRYETSTEQFHYEHRQVPFEELAPFDFWQLSVQGAAEKGGVPLGDVCRISVGVTTLSDKLFIFTLEEYLGEGLVRVKSKNGEVTLLEKSILKPIIKASRLKSTEEPITEYILFPYQKNENGKHTIVPEELLEASFPNSYAYLLKQRALLDRRDNGKPNAVAWYAFGRAQSLDTSFGKKIIFSPMNRQPNFILSNNPDTSVYSGYFIKYEGDYDRLLKVLNSPQMAEYMTIAGRDFRGGWKGYSKKIVGNFRVDPLWLTD